MTETRSGRAAPAVDPERLFERLAAVSADERGAVLDEMAERIREVVPADLVGILVADELDAQESAIGWAAGSSALAEALLPLLPRDGPDPLGVAEEALRRGTPVHWPRVADEEAAIDRLARLAEHGRPGGAIHRLLADASAVATPLSTPGGPRRGAVVLLGLTSESRLADETATELAALGAPISLAVRAQQLSWRNRRTRRTLEGVINAVGVGIVVSDARGRLSLSNRAAEGLLGIELGSLVGRPMSELVAERIKWRFTNPEEYESRILEVYGDERRVAEHDLETIDGRVIEHHTGPLGDARGRPSGRFEALTDVTSTRQALAAERRLATERTGLLEREERRAHEEVALTRAAHLMASALTRDDIHEHLLQQAAVLAPACEKGAVLILDRRGDVFPAATHGFDAGAVTRMTFDPGEGVVGRVLASRRPFICNDAEADPRVASRIVRAEGIRSFMHVPLVLGERPYGLLSVNSPEPRAFGERELRVLSELARHAGAALQNALQFEQERHIAETLQQSLLADALPEVPGLTLATLYQAAAGSQVGGDFYSVWTQPDGRVALLVGDVSGKGIDAAGVTAMVRYMAEGLGRHHAEPGALLTELNELVYPRLASTRLVTMFLSMLDPVADRLHWSSAGHPPPLVLAADGGIVGLEDPDPPCGAFPGTVFRSHRTPLGRGALLFVYTDGLLEARRRDGRMFGEDGLRAALVDAAVEAPRALARSVYAAARTWCEGRINDDVAIAVIKREG